MQAREIRRADRGDGNERAVSERLPARVVQYELIDNTARAEEEDPEPCALQLIVNVNTTCSAYSANKWTFSKLNLVTFY